jgi:hypothetical protein
LLPGTKRGEDGQMKYVADCWCCDGKIEGTASAVSRAGEVLLYIPFARDANTACLLAHPACFAGQHGVDALVAVIHEHDWQTIERKGSA